MKRLLLAALLLPFATGGAAAQQAGRPKLIVAISVDQFSADLFAQYRQYFDGGLKRLSEGIVFPSGYQSHAATETCPGHSTILTGSRPARTGIIANTWFNLRVGREDKAIYCAEDERISGTSSKEYRATPYHLRVLALGDHMKRADSRSRVAVVAGKDRAAMMMGGYAPDQRWWWSNGAFIGTAPPPPGSTAAAVNAEVVEALARPREARPLPGHCERHSRAIALPGTTRTVGDGRFARDAGDKSGFRASPDLDAATLELADGMRRELRLGQGEATDLLVIGVSATDYVGHGYGTQGSEMCIQLLALDRELGAFFRKLDATGIDYAVMLTADHGGHDLPERHSQHAIAEAMRVDPALGATAMGKVLGEKLKLQGPVLYGDGPFGDIYVDLALRPEQRRRALAAAVAAYRAHPQVAAVFTAAEIKAAPPPSGPPDRWSLLDRVKASYDAERSGDFVVLLKPRITPIAQPGGGYVSTHGSPWDYDRRVPILFWRKGMTGFEQSLAVETADILPTLAALIGLAIAPGTIDGRCLDLDEGPASTCPAP